MAVVRQFLQDIHPMLELFAALEEERAHIRTVQDDVPFFVGILANKRFAHLFRRRLDGNIDRNDPGVEAVEALEAHQRVDDNNYRQQHEDHLAEQHFARDIQLGKKLFRDQFFEEGRRDEIGKLRDSKVHGLRVTNIQVIVK
jgi:hypothetical protein